MIVTRATDLQIPDACFNLLLFLEAVSLVASVLGLIEVTCVNETTRVGVEPMTSTSIALLLQCSYIDLKYSNNLALTLRCTRALM